MWSRARSRCAGTRHERAADCRRAQGRPIGFRFDGRDFTGRDGDTIASALLANGVRIVGRSFKYHRPRGIFGAWTEEPNALVDVTIAGRTTPNLRATTEQLVEGMVREVGQRQPDRRTPIATALSTASRGSSRPASTTRRSCGRTGTGSSRASAPWPGSAASIPATSRRPAARTSTQAATCWWSAPVRPALPPRVRRRRRASASSWSTTSPSRAAR